MNQSLYTRSILIGGVTAGILSGLPVIWMVNCCCCCIWVIMGGMLASYVFVYSAKTYPNDGDGALVGLGAGAIAGIIGATLITITNYFSAPSFESLEPFLTELPIEFQEGVREGMEGGVSLASTLFQMFVIIIVFSAMSTLGGLIGIRIFRPLRMKSPAAPPWYNYYNWPGQPMPPYPGGPGPYGAPPPMPGPPSPSGPPAGAGQGPLSEQKPGNLPWEEDDKNKSGGGEPPAWGGGQESSQ